MTKFEDALLERLKQHEPDPAAALPPRHRLVPLGAAAITVLAALAAVILPSIGDNGATAHAVTRNPDGTVTISWKDLKDVDTANKELRDLGVTNVVIIGPAPRGTCAPGTELVPGVFPPDEKWISGVAAGDDFSTIRPDLIPAGHTAVLIGILFDPNDDVATGAVVGVVRTQERYCMESHAPPEQAPTSADSSGSPTVSLAPAPPEQAPTSADSSGNPTVSLAPAPPSR